MAAKDSSNLEHATLVSLTDTLVKAISLDQSDVALKLVAESIIPHSSITSDSKAADIFDKVLNAVEINPESYEKFLGVIDQCPCIKSQADAIRKVYTKKKLEQQQSETQEELVNQTETGSGQVSPPVKRKSESSRATRLDSESDQEQETKFPYLKDEGMTKEERERLIVRLAVQSGRMKDEFALLVDRARESLERQKIPTSELKVLIKHSQRNDLVSLFEKMKRKKIADLFYALSDYWSFFDYEFLALIIKRHCPELKQELKNYEDCLKKFCRRRLCEIPSDVFKTKRGHKYNLYVKYNQKVDVIKLETAKQLELKLSELLETELYLLEVQEGCVELVFDSFCELDDQFPLKKEQKEQLRDMEVLEIRSGEDKYSVSRNIASNMPSSEKTESVPVSDTDSGNDSMSLGSSVSDSAAIDYDSFSTTYGFKPAKYYGRPKKGCPCLKQLWKDQLKISALPMTAKYYGRPKKGCPCLQQL